MKQSTDHRCKAFPATAGLLCLALAGFAHEPAAAQPEERMAECAAIDNDERRLACFDELLRPAAPAAAQPAAASGPAPDAEPPAAPGPANPANPAGRATETAAATGTANAAETAAAAEPQGRRRGNDDAEPPLTLTIVAVHETIIGRSFTADNGDIYLQTSPGRPLNSDPPFTATLEPASFGSFFLLPEGGSRVRVSLRD